jgi:hypothetical protein
MTMTLNSDGVSVFRHYLSVAREGFPDEYSSAIKIFVQHVFYYCTLVLTRAMVQARAVSRTP